MPTTLTRSLLVVLVPGVVAVAPWILALVLYTEATLGLDKYPTIGNALLFACVAVVGSVLEGLGTLIEVHWDKNRESQYQVAENWHAYLARSFEVEPVGYRYMARLVTTLYFELSMFFATPIFIAGSAVLIARRFPELLCSTIAVAIVLLVGVAWYFFWQASCTHRVLCETRRELNRRLPPNTSLERTREG